MFLQIREQNTYGFWEDLPHNESSFSPIFAFVYFAVQCTVHFPTCEFFFFHFDFWNHTSEIAKTSFSRSLENSLKIRIQRRAGWDTEDTFNGNIYKFGANFNRAQHMKRKWANFIFKEKIYFLTKKRGKAIEIMFFFNTIGKLLLHIVEFVSTVYISIKSTKFT